MEQATTRLSTRCIPRIGSLSNATLTPPYKRTRHTASTTARIAGHSVDIGAYEYQGPFNDVDLVVSEITAPIEAMSGLAIEVSWTLTNQGDGGFDGTFRDNVYLSDDNAPGGDQLLAGFDFTGTIAAGESISRIQTITLPDPFEGERWIVVQTDAGNLVTESDEDNNASASDTPIAIEQRPYPNLIVSQVTSPANAFSGQSTELTWVVTNSGTGATDAPYWYDDVWLSEDSVFGGDTYLGSVANVSFLDSGDSYLNRLEATIPRGLAGTYYFIVRADMNNDVLEYDSEGDNIGASDPLAVEVPPLPDLQVTDVDTPSIAFSGTDIEVQWTVANRGGSAVRDAAWTDRIYLSADETLGGGDQLLRSVTRNVDELLPSDELRHTATVTLPHAVWGDFFIIVQADANNQVFEHAWEDNNTGAGDTVMTVNLTPPPDLEMQFVDAPTAAVAGHSFTVDYGVANFGGTATPNGSWTDRLYLSTDATFDPAEDSLFGTRTHRGALGVNESYTAGITATLPNGMEGTYYAFLWTDSSDVVFELNNDNNNLGDGVPMVVNSYPANLTPLSIDGPASALNGQSVLVDWSVQNVGIGDTIRSRWVDHIYISVDTTLGDDLLLWSQSHNDLLGVSETYVAESLVTIPFNLPSGEYHLILETDSGNSIYEGVDEGDNAISTPILISQELPDLQVVDVTMDDLNPTAGDSIEITWTVANFGPRQTNATYWHDQVYLSADTELNGSNRYLGQFQHNNALPGYDGLSDPAGYTTTRTVTLPGDVSGGFFILIKADGGNRVFEGSLEHNNVGANDPIDVTGLPPVIIIPNPKPVTIPDLVAQSVTVDEDGISGQMVTVDWTVENIADPIVGKNWYDAVYLSRDQVFDRQSDIYLGHAYFPAPASGLDTGESYARSKSFRIPTGLAGAYYAVVASDGGNHVRSEPSELNNIAFSATMIDVTLPQPVDLVAGEIIVPANGTLGQSATITYTVENHSPTTLNGSWTDTLYISVDDQWDINDALFESVAVSGPLAANPGNYTRSVTAALPGVVPGAYHVIVRSDIRNQVLESVEDNNLAASLDQVTLDAELLTLGVPTSTGLQARQFVYYQLHVSADEDVADRTGQR